VARQCHGFRQTDGQCRCHAINKEQELQCYSQAPAQSGLTSLLTTLLLLALRGALGSEAWPALLACAPSSCSSSSSAAASPDLGCAPAGAVEEPRLPAPPALLIACLSLAACWGVRGSGAAGGFLALLLGLSDCFGRLPLTTRGGPPLLLSDLLLLSFTRWSSWDCTCDHQQAGKAVVPILPVRAAMQWARFTAASTCSDRLLRC
jgi:hypothetical protein